MLQSELDMEFVDGVLTSVDGWLGREDATRLSSFAGLVADRYPAPVIVEIGSDQGRSGQGRSTIALALPLVARGRGSVYAIDPHRGEPSADFLRSVYDAGASGVVFPIRDRARDSAVRFGPRSVHMLFLGRASTYFEVKRDLAEWTSRLAPGAIVAVDNAGRPGVNRALREAFASPKSPFRHAAFHGKIVYSEFEPNKPWGVLELLDAACLRCVLLAVVAGRKAARMYRQVPAQLATLRTRWR